MRESTSLGPPGVNATSRLFSQSLTGTASIELFRNVLEPAAKDMHLALRDHHQLEDSMRKITLALASVAILGLAAPANANEKAAGQDLIQLARADVKVKVK